MYSLSFFLSVVTMPVPSVVVYFNVYDNSSFFGSQVSHVLFFLCLWFETVPCCCCAVGLVFLFFAAPFFLLAVFYQASAFNSDVSKWNTGAVTNMDGSKCTLSLPLCGHGVFRCGVLLNIYTTARGSSGHNSHTFCSFLFVCGLKRDPLLLFVWLVWSFFSLLHHSLFLQCFLAHLRSIRTCPNGIRVR